MADAEGQGYKLQGSSNLSTIPPTYTDHIGIHPSVDNGNDGICVFVAFTMAAGKTAGARQPIGPSCLNVRIIRVAVNDWVSALE